MYDNLFEPIQVGRVTIPNRIVRAPHGTLLEGDELAGVDGNLALVAGRLGGDYGHALAV